MQANLRLKKAKYAYNMNNQKTSIKRVYVYFPIKYIGILNTY